VYLINSFEDLGWADPFPDEDYVEMREEAGAKPTPKKKPSLLEPEIELPEEVESTNGESITMAEDQDPDLLVYPESRYGPDESPAAIHLPSRDVMFKLMRACIGVEKPADLWINQKGYEID